MESSSLLLNSLSSLIPGDADATAIVSAEERAINARWASLPPSPPSRRLASPPSLTSSNVLFPHGLAEYVARAPRCHSSTSVDESAAAAATAAADESTGVAHKPSLDAAGPSAMTTTTASRARGPPPPPLTEVLRGSRLGGTGTFTITPTTTTTAAAATGSPLRSPSSFASDERLTRGLDTAATSLPSTSLVLEAARLGPMSTTSDALAGTTTTQPPRHVPVLASSPLPRTHGTRAAALMDTSTDSHSSQIVGRRAHEEEEEAATAAAAAALVMAQEEEEAAQSRRTHRYPAVSTPSTDACPSEWSHAPRTRLAREARGLASLPSDALPSPPPQGEDVSHVRPMASVASAVGTPRALSGLDPIAHSGDWRTSSDSARSSPRAYADSPAMPFKDLRWSQPSRAPSTDRHSGSVKRARLERSSPNEDDGSGSFICSGRVNESVHIDENSPTASGGGAGGGRSSEVVRTLSANVLRRRGFPRLSSSLLPVAEDPVAGSTSSWSVLSRGAHTLTPLEDDVALSGLGGGSGGGRGGGGMLFTHDPMHPFGLLTPNSPGQRPASAHAARAGVGNVQTPPPPPSLPPPLTSPWETGLYSASALISPLPSPAQPVIRQASEVTAQATPTHGRIASLEQLMQSQVSESPVPAMATAVYPRKHTLRPRMQAYPQNTATVSGSARRRQELREILAAEGGYSLSSSVLTSTPPHSPSARACGASGPVVVGQSVSDHAAEHFHALPLPGAPSPGTVVSPPQQSPTTTTAAITMDQSTSASLLTPPHSLFQETRRSLESLHEETATSSSLLTSATPPPPPMHGDAARTVPPSTTATTHKAAKALSGSSSPGGLATPPPVPPLSAGLFHGPVSHTEEAPHVLPPHVVPDIPGGFYFSYSYTAGNGWSAQAAREPVRSVTATAAAVAAAAGPAPHATHYDPFAFVNSAGHTHAGQATTTTTTTAAGTAGTAASPSPVSMVAGSALPVNESFTSLSSPAHTTFGLFRPAPRTAPRTLSGTTGSITGFLDSMPAENELYGTWSASPVFYGQPSPLELPLRRRRSARSVNSVASSMGAFFQPSRGASTLMVHHRDGTRYVTTAPIAPYVDPDTDPRSRDGRRHFNDSRELSWSFIASGTPTSGASSTYFSSSAELASTTSAVGHDGRRGVQPSLCADEEAAITTTTTTSMATPPLNPRHGLVDVLLSPSALSSPAPALASFTAFAEAPADEANAGDKGVVCDVLSRAPHRTHFYTTNPTTGEKKPRYRRFLRRHRRVTAAAVRAVEAAGAAARLVAEVDDGPHVVVGDTSSAGTTASRAAGRRTLGATASARATNTTATTLPNANAATEELPAAGASLSRLFSGFDVPQSSRSNGTHSGSLSGSAMPTRALVMPHSRSASGALYRTGGGIGGIGGTGSELNSFVDMVTPLALSFSHNVNPNGVPARLPVVDAPHKDEEAAHTAAELAAKTAKAAAAHGHPAIDFRLSTASLLFYDDVDDDALPIIDHRLRKHFGAPLWYEDAAVVELDESARHAAAAAARAGETKPSEPLRFFQSRRRKPMTTGNEEAQDGEEGVEEEDEALGMSLSLPDDALFFVVDAANPAKDYRLEDYFMRCPHFVRARGGAGAQSARPPTAEAAEADEDDEGEGEDDDDDDDDELTTTTTGDAGISHVAWLSTVDRHPSAAGTGLVPGSVSEHSLGSGWHASMGRIPPVGGGGAGHAGHAGQDRYSPHSSPLPATRTLRVSDSSAGIFSLGPSQLGAGVIFDELPSTSRLSLTGDELATTAAGVAAHTSTTAATAISGTRKSSSTAAVGGDTATWRTLASPLAIPLDTPHEAEEGAMNASACLSEGSAASPLQMALARRARRATAVGGGGGGAGGGENEIHAARRAAELALELSARQMSLNAKASPTVHSVASAAEFTGHTPSRAGPTRRTTLDGAGDEDDGAASLRSKSAADVPFGLFTLAPAAGLTGHPALVPARHTHQPPHRPRGFVYPGEGTHTSAATRALMSGLVCIDLGGKLTYVDPRTATGAVKLLVDAALLQQQQLQQRRQEEEASRAAANTNGHSHSASRSSRHSSCASPSPTHARRPPHASRYASTSAVDVALSRASPTSPRGVHEVAAPTHAKKARRLSTSTTTTTTTTTANMMNRSPHLVRDSSLQSGDWQRSHEAGEDEESLRAKKGAAARGLAHRHPRHGGPVIRRHTQVGGHEGLLVGEAGAGVVAGGAVKGGVGAFTSATPPRYRSAQLVDASVSPGDTRRGFQPTLPFFQVLQARVSPPPPPPPTTSTTAPSQSSSHPPQRRSHPQPGSSSLLSGSLKSHTSSSPVAIPLASAHSRTQLSTTTQATAAAAAKTTTQKMKKAPRGVLARARAEAATSTTVSTRQLSRRAGSSSAPASLSMSGKRQKATSSSPSTSPRPLHSTSSASSSTPTPPPASAPVPKNSGGMPVRSRLHTTTGTMPSAKRAGSGTASSISPTATALTLSSAASSPYTENRPVARRLLVDSSQEPVTPLPPALGDVAVDAWTLDSEAAKRMQAAPTTRARTPPSAFAFIRTMSRSTSSASHRSRDGSSASDSDVDTPAARRHARERQSYHTPAAATATAKGGERDGSLEWAGGSSPVHSTFSPIRSRRAPAATAGAAGAAAGLIVRADKHTSIAAAAKRAVGGNNADSHGAGAGGGAGGGRSLSDVSQEACIVATGGGILVSKSSFRRHASARQEADAVPPPPPPPLSDRVDESGQEPTSALTRSPPDTPTLTSSRVAEEGESRFALGRTRSNVALEAAARYTAAARSVGRSPTVSHVANLGGSPGPAAGTASGGSSGRSGGGGSGALPLNASVVMTTNYSTPSSYALSD